MFVSSGKYFTGSSVMEIYNSGVPLEKIVIGKPVEAANVFNTGLISSDVFASIYK